MSEVFRAADLLNSLIELEKTGCSFYREASERIRDDKISGLFRCLSGEEAKHAKLYESLSGELSRTEAVTEAVDEDYDAYLKVLLHQNFHFTADDFRTMDEALRFAVSLEKDTLIYVGEMQNLLGNRKADLFEAIKREERRHLRMLSEYRSERGI